MIPVSDIIPTRTPPVLTVALIALAVLFAFASGLHHAGSLAANVACLWLFGWTLEDRLGRARFAVLFGTCAGLAWQLASRESAVAGGTGGVLGAYFLLYPRSLVLVLVPLPSLVREVPAITLLALWFVSQLALGPFPFLPQLAGFLSGAGLCLVLKRPERLAVDWWSPQADRQATDRAPRRGRASG